MIDYVLPSLLNLIDPFNICLMLLGLTGGIITGALPGLSATMGVALMVPVTFAMNPTSGLLIRCNDIRRMAAHAAGRS